VPLIELEAAKVIVAVSHALGISIANKLNAPKSITSDKLVFAAIVTVLTESAGKCGIIRTASDIIYSLPYLFSWNLS
jgi:hypothetical protein